MSEARELTIEERAWVDADLALRRKAEVLAARYERDAEDMYRTLKHLARSPAERLRIGLNHGRLRTHGSRTQVPE